MRKLTVASLARHAANVEVHGSSQLARAAANAIVLDMRLIVDDQLILTSQSRQI
jgi:hypothetical protein